MENIENKRVNGEPLGGKSGGIDLVWYGSRGVLAANCAHSSSLRFLYSRSRLYVTRREAGLWKNLSGGDE
jgi:hypothetical protein